MTTSSHPYAACLCLASRRLARVLTQAYDEALAAEGLKITQFSVMCALDYRKDKAVPLSAVAEALDIEPSSLTRALGPLARDGLIELSHGKDRRQRFGRLTESGRQKLETARERWARVQERTGAHLGFNEMTNLIDHLNTSRRRIQENAGQVTNGDMR